MQNQMFFPVTDDVKQQTAQRFEDQNEITVMDESMPSPGGIRSEETIVLPEIVSMPEYIRRHYAAEIMPFSSACSFKKTLQFHFVCAKLLLSFAIADVLPLLFVMQLPDRISIIAKGVFLSYSPLKLH